MKRIISYLLILTLVFSCIPSFASETESTSEEILTDEVITVGAHDIWLHSDGKTWQASGKPGATVTIPFNTPYTPKGEIFSVTVDYLTEFKGMFTDKLDPNAVTQAKAITEVKPQDGRLKVTIQTKLEAKLEPKIITEGWQAEKVEGQRYYIPLIYTIKYKAAPECTACGDPLTTKEADKCASGVCDKFGTADCGCFEPTITNSASGTCKDSYSWAEKQKHTVYDGCGSAESPCPGHPCWHTYTYKASLSGSTTLKAATPAYGFSQSPIPQFKSGYGFSVNYPVTCTVKLISETSSRCGGKLSHTMQAKVTAPTAGYVTTNWTVINKDKRTKQEKTVKLACSVSGLKSTLTCAANPVSNYNKKLIYTDVTIDGTRKKPVTHTIKVTANKGYVKIGSISQELCLTKTASFKIVGDMYEDDYTVDGGY